MTSPTARQAPGREMPGRVSPRTRQKELHMTAIVERRTSRNNYQTDAFKASRRDAPGACASCGREVARRARRQRFCSARCREKARIRVRRAPSPGRPSKNVCSAIFAREPLKKCNETSGAQRAKIRATKDVLDIEVWGGRTWQHAVSAGGVSIEVGRLRTRTLVGASLKRAGEGGASPVRNSAAAVA